MEDKSQNYLYLEVGNLISCQTIIVDDRVKLIRDWISILPFLFFLLIHHRLQLLQGDQCSLCLDVTLCLECLGILFLFFSLLLLHCQLLAVPAHTCTTKGLSHHTLPSWPLVACFSWWWEQWAFYSPSTASDFLWYLCTQELSPSSFLLFHGELTSALCPWCSWTEELSDLLPEKNRLLLICKRGCLDLPQW